MSRSLKKTLFTSKKLLAKVEKHRNSKPGIPGVFSTWSRSSVITPEMIGHTFLIHNGQKFMSRTITAEMVGYKLGEFSPTRRFGQHGKAGKH